MTITNTIGTVRVACSNGATVRSAGSSHDDVRRERDQFRRVSAKVVGIGRGPARVDPHVAAVGPAQLRQRLAGTPRCGPVIPASSAAEAMRTPMRRIPLGLLRARRERPRRRRAAEQRDELAARSFDHLVGALL